MLLVSAVEFGLRFGLSIIRFTGPDTIQFWNPDHPWWIWLLSVIQLGGYAVLYQGLLYVQQLISSMLPYGIFCVDESQATHASTSATFRPRFRE
jgi:hypothetical protein